MVIISLAITVLCENSFMFGMDVTWLCICGLILYLAINYMLLKKKPNVIGKYSKMRIVILVYYIITLIGGIASFHILGILVVIASAVGITGSILNIASVCSFVNKNKENLMREIARSRMENKYINM